MKKVFILTMAAAVACLMGACKKEGVYNPKQKIARIYVESHSTNAYFDGNEWQTYTYDNPKELVEEWTWDGKLLTQIAYPYTTENADGDITTIYEYAKFTYDGKQLTEVSSDWERMVFTYDGKKLDKAELYYSYNINTKAGNEPDVVFNFIYDGKKISKVGVSYEDIDFMNKAGVKQRNGLMQMLEKSILPDVRGTERMMAAACDKARKAGAKGRINLDMNLTWDGNNISRIITSHNGMVFQTDEYTFDNKKNPFNGFLFTFCGDLVEFEDSPMMFGNENNILSTKSIEAGNDEAYTVNYTYTYDGNWPVSVSYSSGSEDEYNRWTNVVTSYYEYK